MPSILKLNVFIGLYYETKNKTQVSSSYITHPRSNPRILPMDILRKYYETQ